MVVASLKALKLRRSVDGPARQTRSATGYRAQCICADALVGPGVTVDEGAILGAGGDRVEGRETVDDCC
jgi:hypothetical protein